MEISKVINDTDFETKGLVKVPSRLIIPNGKNYKSENITKCVHRVDFQRYCVVHSHPSVIFAALELHNAGAFFMKNSD